MKLLPAALNVAGRRCVICGGGPVAARKANALLECGADVLAMAPIFCADWQPIENQIQQCRRAFTPGDCIGAALVFACTDSREINAQIVEDAHAAGALCNVADDAEGGDFHSMATLRRGDICVGIATGGASPALARHLKAKISETIGPEYASLLELLAARRAGLPDALTEQRQRAAFWRAILSGPVLDLLREGRRAEAEQWIAELRIEN